MSNKGPAAGDRPVLEHSKPATSGSLALAVAAYTLARLVLVVVVAVVIVLIGLAFGVEVPWIVAGVFGVLIAMPLGLWAFKPLRLRVNAQIDSYNAERTAREQDLRDRMRGRK